MSSEFDPAKDAANRLKHSVSLEFGVRLFEDAEMLIVPTIRKGDEEERYKAIGMVDGACGPRSTSIAAREFGSSRCEGAMPVSKEHTIAIPPDPADPEDRAASAAGLERAHVGRAIRRLRHRLGLSQSEFADRYGIPVANVRQYEIGRTMPPPTVRSFLKVIAAEPERTAAAVKAA